METPAEIALDEAAKQLEAIGQTVMRSDAPHIAQAAALIGIGYALIEIAAALREQPNGPPIRETPWQARERQQEGATQ